MKRQISTLLIGLLCLTSCGNDEVTDRAIIEPEPIPQVYELVSIEFTPDTCGFDTIPGDPLIFHFENPSDDTIAITKSVSLESISLSTFYIPDLELPAGSNIPELLTNIPDIDGEPKVIGLTIREFPFAFEEKQKIQRSGSIKWETKVPPHKRMKLSHWYIGYELTATYHAILKNQYTGEQLELNGKWKGLQQRNTKTVVDEEELK